MRTRTVWALLALALAAAASATASTKTTTAAPKLALLHRAPLVVRGTHFRGGERVRLTAAAGTTHAVAIATATRRGGLVARFHYVPPVCVKLLVLAKGARGDHAKLVVKPPGGSTGIPCGL
jgi:hypothetical protein